MPVYAVSLSGYVYRSRSWPDVRTAELALSWEGYTYPAKQVGGEWHVPFVPARPRTRPPVKER